MRPTRPDVFGRYTAAGSEDVHGIVHPGVELLLLPVVPTVGVTEDAEDPVAAVFVAIIRALNLRDDPLFARIAIPAVVKAVILEAVAGDLRRDVRPGHIVVPVLRLGRLDPAEAEDREGQGQHLDP